MSEQDNMVQALFESMSADSVSTVKDSGAALGELVARLSPAKENAVSLYPFYSGASPAQITTEQFSRAPEQKPDEERTEETATEETATEETSTEVIPGDEQTAHEDAMADAVIAAVTGQNIESTEDETFPGVPVDPAVASAGGGGTARLYDQITSGDDTEDDATISPEDDAAPAPTPEEPAREPDTARSFTQESTATWQIEVLDHEREVLAATTVHPVIVQEVTPDERGVLHVTVAEDTTWQDAAIRAGREFIREHTSGVDPAGISWRRRGSTVRIILPETEPDAPEQSPARREAPTSRMRRASATSHRTARAPRRADPAEVLDRVVSDLDDPTMLRGRTVSGLYRAEGGNRQVAERVAARIGRTVVMVRDEADLPYLTVTGTAENRGEAFYLSVEHDVTPEALADEVLRFMHTEPNGGLGDDQWIIDPDATAVTIAFCVEDVTRKDTEFTYRFTAQVVR